MIPNKSEMNILTLKNGDIGKVKWLNIIINSVVSIIITVAGTILFLVNICGLKLYFLRIIIANSDNPKSWLKVLSFYKVKNTKFIKIIKTNKSK